MNILSLNADKAKHIFFHKQKDKNITSFRFPDLKINNICLKRVKKLNFLGVVLDENLNWQSHIALMWNKISKNIGLLFKASLILSSICPSQLYFPMFIPASIRKT